MEKPMEKKMESKTESKLESKMRQGNKLIVYQERMSKIKIVRGMLIAVSILTFAGSTPVTGGVFPAAVVQAASGDESSSGTAVIRADSLNVRSGPGKDYDVVGSAKSGEEYAITGESENGWYPVDFGGVKGYVSGEYIEIVTAQAGDEAGGETEGEQEPEEEGEERGPIPGIPGIWQKITKAGPAAVAACVLIPVVLIGIIFTVKGMLRREDDEYDEDEEYYDTDYDEDYDEAYEEGEYEEEYLYEEDSVYDETAPYDEEPYLTDDAGEDYQSAEQIMAECTENFRREFAEAEQRKKAKSRNSR